MNEIAISPVGYWRANNEPQNGFNCENWYFSVLAAVEIISTLPFLPLKPISTSPLRTTAPMAIKQKDGSAPTVLNHTTSNLNRDLTPSNSATTTPNRATTATNCTTIARNYATTVQTITDTNGARPTLHNDGIVVGRPPS